MDKAIRAHERMVRSRLEILEHKPDLKQLQKLYAYHIDRVRDFQHERQIHLLVTFFFAGLLLVVMGGLLAVMALAPYFGSMSVLVTLLTLFVTLLLFVVELFYVKYYYALENGTQRLYKLSIRLHDLLQG